MKEIFMVTMGASNAASRYQFVFDNLEEAEKLMNHLDKDKGASGSFSIISRFVLYNKASQLIGESNETTPNT